MDHTRYSPPQNGGRIMYLKLQKARLEALVAYTRLQLMRTEMELRTMENELQSEVQKSTTTEPEPPTRPQTKKPHKFVKLLSGVFKSSNSNHTTEQPGTTASTPEIKEDLAKKRKNVEASGMSKKSKSGSDKEYKVDRNNSRSNKQEAVKEEADNSKKNSKEKKQSSDKKKKTIETGRKEDKATEKKHSDSNKKDKITKEPKAKHSSRPHKHEQAKEKDDRNSKVDKGLKSILKKSCITEAMNKNVPENISAGNRGEDEGSVEFNIRKMFNSPLHSNNNSDSKMETTTADKATSTVLQSDAFVEIRENIFIKENFFKEAESDVFKVVDATLDSLQNNELFKELRNSQVKTEQASPIGSLETLVLGEDSEDRKMEFIM